MDDDKTSGEKWKRLLWMSTRQTQMKTTRRYQSRWWCGRKSRQTWCHVKFGWFVCVELSLTNWHFNRVTFSFTSLHLFPFKWRIRFFSSFLWTLYTVDNFIKNWKCVITNSSFNWIFFLQLIFFIKYEIFAGKYHSMGLFVSRLWFYMVWACTTCVFIEWGNFIVISSL